MFITRARLRGYDDADPPERWQPSGLRYPVHQQVWRLFERNPASERFFLFRQEVHRGRSQLLIISACQPLLDGRESGLWSLETKPYEPHLKTGEDLAFVLRANPVRSKKDGDGRSHRHDVVMDAKNTLRSQGVARCEWPDEVTLVQKKAVEWLSSRAASRGFQLCHEQVVADGYRQHRLRRPKGGGTIHLSTVDFAGRLTVQDEEAFSSTLMRGIGPAKGFGCGLMLVRRVG